MKKIKLPLIFFIIALVLSFLIGLISGVNFWSIVMRSVILGLITGAFVFGADMLLSHFVPELFSQSDSTSSEASEEVSVSGKNVNISIDDPIDLEAVADGDENKKEKAPEASVVAENNQEDEFDNDIEELEELDAGLDETNKNASAGEIPVSAENNNTGTNNEIKGDAAEVEELSELPDLKEFVPLEEVSAASAEETDFTQVGTGKFDVSADLNSTEVDTNLMAEAVKTVLRRES